ncbi:signal recognition particle-docking protein FtsY [Pendulispora rubella]|uniref:Signal recognition particle receptor FtsY n=1 Tax=Pendulispora rubella TaxID=2741070 RepID=A0ABZ2KUA0_9BACT
MEWIIAVVVVVAIAALLFFFRSKKAPEGKATGESREEPTKRLERPANLRDSGAPPKAGPGAKAKAKGEKAEPAAKAEPAPAKKAPTPPPVAEELSQTDLAPADSVRPEAAKPAKRDVAGIRKGLAATRTGFIARLTALFVGKKEIDPAILEQIEEVMLTSDVGVKTTQTVLERLREKLNRNELADPEAVWAELRAEAMRILSLDGGPLRFPTKPSVAMMVGVNGVGKTTTIGKLATKYAGEGKSVLLAAGDTFRAAAVAQLEVWGKRVGAEVVKGKEGSDPGAVAFEATTKAKEAQIDLLLVDTAGRLHTKTPLMDEIKKVRKTIAKAMDGAPHEILLVLDATNGQNALSQAALFKEALDPTGIILTKLDGTAKGGIVLGICDELKLPVRYIGLGERAEDLREFYPDEFVEALFGKPDEEARAA